MDNPTEFELDSKIFSPDFSFLLNLLDEARDSTSALYIIDDSTGENYLNENPSTIRLKCAAFSVAAPIAHSITPIVMAGSKLFKGETPELEDVYRIVRSPITIIELELAALSAIFFPLDARKSIASTEGNASITLAPCFKPSPQDHGLLGNINQKNAW